jgi:hypothetical protein
VNGTTGTGAGFKGIILDTTEGAITDLGIIESGTGYTAADVITVVGVKSGASSGQVTANTVNPKATITTPGDSMVNGTIYATTGGGGSGLTIKSSSTGALTDFTIEAGGSGYSIGDSLTITNPAGTDPIFTLNIIVDNPNRIEDAEGNVRGNGVANGDVSSTPLVEQKDIYADMFDINDEWGMKRYWGPTPTNLEIDTGAIASNARSDREMVVQLDNFMINSRESGVSGKAIAVVSVGADGNTTSVGSQYVEPFNVMYHSLRNKTLSSHNELQVRLTNVRGQPMTSVYEPIRVTLDVRKMRF